MKTIRLASILGLSILLSFGVMGCKSGGDDTAIDPNAGGGGGGTGSETTTNRDRLPEIDANTLFERFLKPVHFDFDSYSLRSDAIATLRSNASNIKEVPGVIIQIEGHCDERGTQEYNLALGERRALATRDYLIGLGISGDRIITISYGEEAPADSGRSEAAWAKNRRCEFNRAL